MQRLTLALASVLLAGPLLATPALSAGGGGGDGQTGQCKKGQIWNGKKCVTPKRGEIDDDRLYEAGRALADAGRYGEAITVLSLAANKSDPRILNYLGYSHRKQGRVQVGLGYYEEALRIDPDYTLVREYLGEAHLQLGDVKAAREQLAEIEKRCGKGCAEYSELSGQIVAFERRG
jgi:tetratricopeptide (TPR) repeat protein